MSAREGTEINGRYRLAEPVGSGGMATVWRARDLRLGRDVAVKLIADKLLDQQDFIDRFRREARIAAGLSHPNLVSVHDLGFFGERPFLVMELIQGETLAARIERNDSNDVVKLAGTLLDVLATVHEAGIVHRDVKPGNILYQDDGRIRLTDFGIARIVDTEGSGPPTTITQSGIVIGTQRYMAPEVRDGAVPTPAADLYSVGVTLAECGAAAGPLAALVGDLRRADPADRPGSARLAAASIAGIEPFKTRPGERSPASVLGAGGGGPAGNAIDTPTPGAAADGGDPETLANPAPISPASTARTVHNSSPVPRRLLIGAAACVAAIAVVAVLIGSLGGQDEPAGTGSGEQASSSNAKGKEKAAKVKPAAPAETEPATPVAPEPETAATTDPVALNDEGYALLQAGDPAGAVPLLEEAVAGFPEGSDDINYAYALFNLGSALRQSGRPEEAIPYLEQRLQFEDQREVVEAELELAREAAE